MRRRRYGRRFNRSRYTGRRRGPYRGRGRFKSAMRKPRSGRIGYRM